MKAEEFRKFHEVLLQDSSDLLFAKMTDYASQEDQLSNFRGAAEALHTSPMIVWAVYFHKHVCAVNTYAATGRVESEHIRERFKDILNYAVLGAALAHEADRGKRVADVGHGGRPGQVGCTT